jgi:hypothetical protein
MFRTWYVPAAALGALLRTAGAAPADPAPSEWRYVVPLPGDPFDHPPLRALTLSDEKPPDVVESAAYRGTHRRYAQLRYGSPASVRVTVVIDEAGPGNVDLYVDARRKRRIEATDRVAGKDLVWRLPLDAAFVNGEDTEKVRRAIVFRYFPAGRTLAFAAAGYLEGTATVAGKPVRARRADGDGNGRFNDPCDRLWLDLDGDGHFDPASEQFLYAPLLTVGGERYAVRTDERGGQLSLEPLQGTGTVRLAAQPAGGPARVVDVSATLIGRDGSAVSLAGTAPQALVPAGDYRLSTVAVALDDPAGGPRWTFLFSDQGRRGSPRWHAVARDGTLTLDPVGALELRTGLDAGATVKSGEALEFQPRLYTGDGLLVVTCVRGTPASSAGEASYAEGVLAGREGRIGTARCGFL